MRKHGLNYKFTVLFLIFSLLLAFLLCSVNYYIYKQDLLKEYSCKASNAAATAAFLLDPEKIRYYSRTGMMDEAYEKEIEFIDNLAYRLGLENLYVLVPLSDEQVMFIYDASVPGDGITDSEYERMVLGAKADYGGENYSAARSAIENGTETKGLEIVNGEFGYLASAYELLYTEEGELIGFIGADFLVSEIEQALKNYLIRNVLLVFVVVSICAVFLLYMIKHMMILPIQKISAAASEFAGAGHDDSLRITRIQVNTGDELEELGDTFCSMMEDILSYISDLAEITAEKERISAELRVASSIQESMLPDIFPAFPDRKDIDIFAVMTPAKEVGGDFYDFFFIDEDHMAVVIADVSGKGIPAALFMVISRTLLKNQALSGKSAGEIFTAVNRQLMENNREGMFVTAFMGILELSTGSFIYANAGHNPPLYREKTGKFQWVYSKPSMVLAGLEGVHYEESEILLKPGDILFLYTDGVTETLNAKEELYGEERLLTVLNQTAEENSELESILDNVQKNLKEFADTALQADDTTMLILRYQGYRSR